MNTDEITEDEPKEIALEEYHHVVTNPLGAWAILIRQDSRGELHTIDPIEPWAKMTFGTWRWKIDKLFLVHSDPYGTVTVHMGDSNDTIREVMIMAVDFFGDCAADPDWYDEEDEDDATTLPFTCAISDRGNLIFITEIIEHDVLTADKLPYAASRYLGLEWDDTYRERRFVQIGYGERWVMVDEESDTSDDMVSAHGVNWYIYHNGCPDDLTMVGYGDNPDTMWTARGIMFGM